MTRRVTCGLRGASRSARRGLLDHHRLSGCADPSSSAATADESTTAPCSIPSPQTSSTYSYVTCIVPVLGWLTSVSRFNSVEVLSKSAGHASLPATCRSISQAALHVLAAVMRACFLELLRVLKRSCENAQYYEETGRYPLRSDSLPALDGHGSSPRTPVPFYNVLFACRHRRSTMEPWKLQTLDHGEEE